MTLSGLGRLLGGAVLAMACAPAMAFDTYRYFHVSIDTVWYIFLFLLPIVLSPFILMAVVYWWHLTHPNADEARRREQGPL
jgi:hypothetical protein